MRLCTLGDVYGAYLVINARHANALFMSVIHLITASAGPLTFWLLAPHPLREWL